MTTNIPKPLLFPYIGLLFLLLDLEISLSQIFWKFSIFCIPVILGLFAIVLLYSPALYIRKSISLKQHKIVCILLLFFPLFCLPIGGSYALITTTCALPILILITQINQEFNPVIQKLDTKNYFSDNVLYLALYGGICFIPLVVDYIYSIEKTHIAPTYHLFTFCFVIGLFILNITTLYVHSKKVAGIVLLSSVWYYLKNIENFANDINYVIGIPFLLLLAYKVIPTNEHFFTKKHEICKFCIGILLPIIQIVSFYIQGNKGISNNIIISQIFLTLFASFFWYKQCFNKRWHFNAKYFMLSGIITFSIILSIIDTTTISIKNINNFLYSMFSIFIMITIFIYIILTKTRNSLYVALAIFLISSIIDVAIEFNKGELQNYIKWLPNVWNKNIIFTLKYTLLFYVVVNYNTIYNYFVDINTNRTLNICKRLLIALVHSALVVLFTWLLGFCYDNCTIHDYTFTVMFVIIVFLHSIIFKPSYKQCVLLYIVTTLFLFKEMIVLPHNNDSFCDINYLKYYTLFYSLYLSILLFTAICYLLSNKDIIPLKQLLQIPIAIYAIKLAIAIPLCFVLFNFITYLLTQTSSICEILTIQRLMNITSTCCFACLLSLSIIIFNSSNKT